MSKLVTVLCAVIFVSVPTQGQNRGDEVDIIYNNALCTFGKATNLVTKAENSLDQETLYCTTRVEEYKNKSLFYAKHDLAMILKACQDVITKKDEFEERAMNNIRASQLDNTTNEAKTLLEKAKESFCLISNQKLNGKLCTKGNEENCDINLTVSAKQEWTEKSEELVSSMAKIELSIDTDPEFRVETDDDPFWDVIDNWQAALSKCEKAIEKD